MLMRALITLLHLHNAAHARTHAEQRDALSELTIGVSLAKVCRSLMLLLTSLRMFFTWELRFWLAAYEHSTPILKATKPEGRGVTLVLPHLFWGFYKADSRGQCAPPHLFTFFLAATRCTCGMTPDFSVPLITNT